MIYHVFFYLYLNLDLLLNFSSFWIEFIDKSLTILIKIFENKQNKQG